MGNLILWNLVTLDGYFEGAKEWDLGFHELVWGQELEEFSLAQLESADMLVFGRNTYKGMADYWRNAEGEQRIAKIMNEIKKVVCSTKLKTAEWNNTLVVEDAVAKIPKLKQQGNRNMYVFGSCKLSESLINASLFDEYRLCVAPVFLGKGRRLFNQGMRHTRLKLLENRPLSNGGVIVRYAPDEDSQK